MINFDMVLAEEVLSVEVENKVRFNIAQIYGSLQKWDKVITSLDEWFRYVSEPKPVAYYMLGIANYQLEKMDLAIANTEKAIELSPDPAESWLQFLAALYIQKEDYKQAAPILEQLVIRFPKKTYWLQLSLVMARSDTKHSLAVQELAYHQGCSRKTDSVARSTSITTCPSGRQCSRGSSGRDQELYVRADRQQLDRPGV
jgi:tetratricopeptide (TPR) repeat protein